MSDICESFGKTLRMIIDELGLSAADVSRTLGHKSKTTLHRILRGQTNARSNRVLYEAFTDIYKEQLTEKQVKQLYQALHFTKEDLEYLKIRGIFYDILFSQCCEGGQSEGFDNTRDYTAWRALSEELRTAKSFRLLVLNCTRDGSLFIQLNRVFTENLYANFSILHYITMPDTKAAAASQIVELLPMLLSKHYQSVTVSAEEAHASPLLRADLAFIQVIDKDGVTRGRLLCGTQAVNGMILETESDAITKVERVIQTQIERPYSNEPAAAANENPFDTYLNLITQYLAAEQDHEIYSVHFDPCVCLVDAAILKTALIDGIRQAGMDAEALSPMVEKLYTIQARRYENIFQKRKVTHAVIYEKGLRAFIETGKLNNEVELLRPFTVEERIRILENLQKANNTNPYFTLYLYLGKDLPEMRTSITYFAESGMAFNRRDNPYMLSGTDGDGFIGRISYGDLFYRFLREEIINNPDQLVPDTDAYFEKQLEYLKGLQGKGKIT